MLTETRWNAFRFFELSAFFLALSFHWSILISVVLQSQVERFAPEHLQGTSLGLIMGFGGVISALVQIVVGWQSDRTGSRWGRRRPYLVAGTLTGMVGLAMMAGAGSLAAVAAAYAVIQLTFNVANGPYQALLPDLVPKACHGMASMWMGLCRTVGEAAGPLAAGLILSASAGSAGLARLMGLDAAILLLFLALTLRVKEPPAEPAPADGASVWDAFRVPLRGYPDFVRLLVSRFVINMGFYTAVAMFYFYVQHSLGVEDYKAATGKLMAAIVAAGLLGGLPAGPLSDRFSKVKLIYVANALTVGAAIWFVMAPDYASAVPAGLLMGLGFGAFSVADWALAFNLLPPGGKGRYMGVWNLTAVIPMLAGPMLAGPFTDLLKAEMGAPAAYRGAMATVAVYLAVGTLLLAGLKEAPSAEAPR